jgi:hypothetical protein
LRGIKMRKLLAVILAVILAISLTTPSFAADKAALDKAVSKTTAYMLKTVKDPQVDSVGGEWAVIGLARSGYSVPDTYYANYYKTVAKYVKDCSGILHDRKYTEYSRLILGLTAAGYDPRDVEGYDLTAPLGDFERTVWQGINGPIFALIALDSYDYLIPENKAAQTLATRELYLIEILRRQTPDGGWNLTAGSSGAVGANERGDADLTGMALQALAKYQSKPEIKAATDKALAFLSNVQDKTAGYGSGFSSGSSAVESAAQVLVALCELGISIDDPRFAKNKNTLVDNILSYKNEDGSFKHTADGSGNNQMSTEQAFYALVAAQRALDGKNSLYRMSDTVKRGGFKAIEITGLPDKHADVKKVPVTAFGKTFADVQNHANRTAIEVLAARGVIDGKSETTFDPDATMKRAEFAAITARGLGLPEKTVSPFTDVSVTAWYAKPVATAYFYGIVTGISAAAFNPEGTITHQEAAVMIARAAKLCGIDTERTDMDIRDTLAQFGDYRTVASWARSSLAFCYGTGILDDSAFNIEPLQAIKRCEVAEMLYRMLKKVNLL